MIVIFKHNIFLDLSRIEQYNMKNVRGEVGRRICPIDSENMPVN